MKSKLSPWQAILILIGFLAIVMFTAYNPKYPHYPEGSIYGAEPSGALLITQVLKAKGISFSVIPSKVENWKPKSTVCIIESNFLFSSLNTSFINNQDLRNWIKQGGKLIVFGLGDYLHNLSEYDPSSMLFTKYEKPDEHKSIKLKPIIVADEIEIKSTLNAMQQTEYYSLSDQGKEISIKTDDMYSENVKALHLDEVPYSILDFTDQTAEKYIDLSLVEKNWNYLVANIQFGSGKIVIVNNAPLIYNQSLVKADNAQFAVNLLTQFNEPVQFVDLMDAGDHNDAKLFSLVFFNSWGRLLIIFAVAIFILRLDDLFYFVKPYPEPKSIRRSIMEYIRAQGWTYYRAKANKLAALALIDGLKRKIMKAYSLPAMPSIQFIVRKISDLGSVDSSVNNSCQIVTSMLHQSEVSENISAAELRILAENLQILEPALLKSNKY